MTGYTQRHVAELLQVKHSQYISRWERGIAFPSLRQVFLLSIIYKTNPFHLYHEVWVELKDIALQREQDLAARNKPITPPESFLV